MKYIQENGMKYINTHAVIAALKMISTTQMLQPLYDPLNEDEIISK